MLKSKETSVPGPTYMSDEQKSHYLSDLRSGRAGRPSGSRPPPVSQFTRLKRSEIDVDQAVPEPEKDGRPNLNYSNSMPLMPHHKDVTSRPQSISRSTSPFVGQPVIRSPSATISAGPEPAHDEVIPALKAVPSIPYVESGTRWMEKQEAKSIRMALEDMDHEKEKELYKNAQDEAAELVWKHRHPEAASSRAEAPYANPDLVKRDYRSHLRKGSYERNYASKRQSLLLKDDVTMMPAEHTTGRRTSMNSLQKAGAGADNIQVQKRRTPSGKSYGGLAEAVATDIAIAHRRTSGGSKRIMSGDKKMFMHPNDRIWEDPQEGSPTAMVPPVIFHAEEVRPAAIPIQPAHIRKNPFARVRLQQDVLERSNSAPELPVTKHNRTEIQRNPPTQSRNPCYTSNELSPLAPPAEDHAENNTDAEGTPTKYGKDIRSEDIRAATSKQRRDRSPNLPQPTVVSDKPGRPIVSFKQRREIFLEESQSAPLLPTSESGSLRQVARTPSGLPAEPTKRSPEPSRRVTPLLLESKQPSFPIPIINLPEDDPPTPSIVLPEEPGVDQGRVSIPSISVDTPSIEISNLSHPLPRGDNPTTGRPLPVPARPLPQHSASSPLPRSTPHYTPSIRQSSILCAACALPIAGRILSAGGSRFHPSCFVCHACSTNLELVAFYPEPETHRLARAEQSDTVPNDPSPRFYCHLDFHEHFSPRCKSCKTPIEGEVIVACGAEWHAGHFFCAQCGDPFDSTTPFVEKDGYAWCVGCHTNRYSAKCRKCRKPVTDVVIKALGAEWHDKCFVCMECNGDFHDGRYFLRGEAQDPVCVRCEERRLKA